MVHPELSAKAVCYLTGGLFTACGAMKLVGYWSKDLYRLAFQFDLAFGLLSLLLGLVMIFHSASIIRLVYFTTGMVALTDGLLKVQTALDSRRFGIPQWWLIAVTALLTILFGLLLIVRPFAGGMWLLRLMGLTILLEGILNLCVGICTVKSISRTDARLYVGGER
ncbi:MAG: hypothetical protein HFI33_04735 [Lachnospiraceae bacterium]|nr:hypothetical protein [Lachnospiraceae bacterium]